MMLCHVIKWYAHNEAIQNSDRERGKEGRGEKTIKSTTSNKEALHEEKDQRRKTVHTTYVVVLNSHY